MPFPPSDAPRKPNYQPSSTGNKEKAIIPVTSVTAVAPITRPGHFENHLRIGWGIGFFDGHITELARFEDLTAFQAFDEFFVAIPGYHLHTRVFARRHLIILLGNAGRRD